jgi:hypothetical protein
MTGSRRARIARLEARHDAEHQESNVILVGLDGLPEDCRYLDGGGPWIFLPRKAASVEEWVETVARRWRYGQEGDES